MTLRHTGLGSWGKRIVEDSGADEFSFLHPRAKRLSVSTTVRKPDNLRVMK
jgi:hypothetical protein